MATTDVAVADAGFVRRASLEGTAALSRHVHPSHRANIALRTPLVF